MALIDGCQAVSHMPVDVRELDADFYVFSGHKLYGPTGIGVLYGKRGILKSMPPYQGGGDMIASVSFAETTYKDPPHRFEAGTPPITEVIGLGAAIEYVSTIGMARIARHEKDLLDYASDKQRAINSLKIIGTTPDKAGIISFVMQGAHPHDIGTILDRQGVAVRAGHHCGPAFNGVSRYRGDGARFFRSLQHEGGRRCARRGASESAGDFCMTEVALDKDLRDLYQDLILDHGKHPRNFRVLDKANFEALGHNPLCGDRLMLYLTVDANNVIQDVTFQGSGCAISVASASMMTEMLKGKNLSEAETLFNYMHGSCTGAPVSAAGVNEDDADRVGALAGVRHYPMRVKCATLAWHTMQAALKNEKKVSTE